MFENDESIVQTLIADSEDFKALYKKHTELKTKVDKAGMRTLALSEDSLTKLKREKLLTKDRLSIMVDDYRRTHSN